MTPAVRAVFLFDQDGDAMTFPSGEDAAGFMEAVDVDAGEYVALFTLDGRIVTATTEAQQVVLTVDEAGLRQRLLDARQRSA